MEIVVMPKLGFNMDEGKLVKWYKSEGDSINKGEPLFAIETDKTSIDVEATQAGIVRRLFIGEGESVPVTLPIAIIADEGENIDDAVQDALVKLGKADGGVSGGEADTSSAPASAMSPSSAPSATPSNGSAAQAEVSHNFDFDVFVIGGGPGGYVAAIKAAQLGKKTAIAEKDVLGGVCLNRGCIPTKTLLRSVEALNGVKEAAEYGITGVDASKAALDFKKVQERKTSVVSQLVGGVGALLMKNKATLLNGEAVIEDKNTVTVNGKPYTAANIIIATGSSVKSLPIEVDKKMNVITSDEALSLTKCPKDIVIVGGGVIGIELAFFLANSGSKVTVVEFLESILPMVDEEISTMVASELESMGIKIITGAAVEKITDKSVVFKKANKVEEIKTANVLMAVGRAPRLDGIDCERLGIKMEKGAITTDAHMRTSIDNIYAIGDVNGKVMLAHTASAEALVAVDNICGANKTMRYDNIPSAIYIEPQIASTGLTEKQAREKYGDLKIGRFPMVGNGKSKVAGDERGMIKVITEAKYGEIVGVHSYCLNASDMIVEAVLAINLEATAEELIDTIHPHPTVSEAYHEAFHAAHDKAIHC